jgi:hypothetical protein
MVEARAHRLWQLISLPETYLVVDPAREMSYYSCSWLAQRPGDSVQVLRSRDLQCRHAYDCT